MSAPTNLSIAQEAKLARIELIAEKAGLTSDDYEPLGRNKAKLTWEGVAKLRSKPQGRLILVTAMTPTPHGEGKTTTSVGLAQGLNRIGHSAVPALREPALGPIFGSKGGACGGGWSQVLPMEEINLFFNGDFPAITAAHGLLSAMVDAHIYHGNDLGFDLRRDVWPRCVDMNDRALREITVGLGGFSNGQPRRDGFVITPASEVMAVLCLSESTHDLKERLGKIVVGQNRKGDPITASQVGAVGGMSVLLKDALRPNLVQTLEGGPALVHGGPFANIAHGCSSLLGSFCGLGLAQYTVTEGGFASDLGAEKFLDIVAPRLGVGPSAIVLVLTVRALKHHGEGSLEAGIANAKRHLAHLSTYGPPVVAAINQFKDDTPEELAQVAALLPEAEVVAANPWGGGGAGCEGLAKAVALACERSASGCRTLYTPDMGLRQKLEAVARTAYGADGVVLSPEAEKKEAWLKKHGFSTLPVCVAKTQNSLSDDPAKLNAPTGFDLHVRDLKVSAGAGFVVALAGEMLLMPGLSKTPAAFGIDLTDEGQITGLF